MSGGVRPGAAVAVLVVVALGVATAAFALPPGADTVSDRANESSGVGAASERVRTVSGCTTISEPGRYRLTRDIEDADMGRNFTFISEACIRIEASDVHLDGDGHTVDGFGVSDTTAIRIAASGELENVTVTDLTVSEWNRAVYVRGVADATISDVNSTGNTFGFFLEGTDNVTVRDSTASTGFVGVYLDDSRSTSLTNVTFGPNHAGDVVREGETTPNTTDAAAATAPANATDAGGSTPAVTRVVRLPPTLATPAAVPRGTRGRPTSP